MIESLCESSVSGTAETLMEAFWRRLRVNVEVLSSRVTILRKMTAKQSRQAKASRKMP